MHQMRADVPPARLRLVEPKSSRLQKVAAPLPSTRLRAIESRQPRRTVTVLDLTGESVLPSLEVGRLAAAVRAAGDEVRVVTRDAAPVGRAWSRPESARAAFVRRCEMLASPLAPAVRAAHELRQLLGLAKSPREFPRIAWADDRAVDSSVVLVTGAGVDAAARAAMHAETLRARGWRVASMRQVLAECPADSRAVVADFTDYPVERTRMLPVSVFDLDGAARSRELVSHEIREHQRRYGAPDLVFVDDALNRHPDAMRALGEDLQRHAPGVVWIASIDPACGDEGLARREIRVLAASGLRRLTIALDAALADADPSAKLARASRIARDAADAGVGIAVRALDLGSATDARFVDRAAVGLLASFLSEHATVIDRVRLGRARPSSAARDSARALLAATKAINMRAAMRASLAFDAID